MDKEVMDLLVENKDDRDTLIRVMVNSGYTVRLEKIKVEGERRQQTHIKAWKE